MKVPQVEVPVWLFLVPLLPKASKERQLLATWKGCLHSSVQALCKDKKSTSSHRAGGPLPLPSSPVCPCTVQPARCIAHRAWVLLLSVRSSLLTTKLPHTHTNRQITMEPAEDWATPRSRDSIPLGSSCTEAALPRFETGRGRTEEPFLCEAKVGTVYGTSRNSLPSQLPHLKAKD